MGKVEDLMAMGFDKNRATGALKMAVRFHTRHFSHANFFFFSSQGGNVEEAITILFSQQDDPPPPAGDDAKHNDPIDLPRRKQEFNLGASVEIKHGDSWIRGMIAFVTIDQVQVQYANDGQMFQRVLDLDHKDLAFEGTHIPVGQEKVKASGGGSASPGGGAGAGAIGGGGKYEFGNSVLVHLGQGVWVPGMVVGADVKNILVQYVDDKNKAAQKKFPTSSDDVKLDVQAAHAHDPSNEERVRIVIVDIFKLMDSTESRSVCACSFPRQLPNEVGSEDGY
jgi:hypothetical protein